MATWLISGVNIWFGAAVAVVITVFLLEIGFMIIGKSGMGVFDTMPDQRTYPYSAPCRLPSYVTHVIKWVGLDAMPNMQWLSLFLTLFAIAGYSVSLLVTKLLPAIHTSSFILPLATTLAVIGCSLCGQSLTTLLHGSHSRFSKAYCGCAAQITVGEARVGNPAEGRFTDGEHQTRYILIEPENAQCAFSPGDTVILVRPSPPYWLAKRYDHRAM